MPIVEDCFGLFTLETSNIHQVFINNEEDGSFNDGVVQYYLLALMRDRKNPSVMISCTFFPISSCHLLWEGPQGSNPSHIVLSLKSIVSMDSDGSPWWDRMWCETNGVADVHDDDQRVSVLELEPLWLLDEWPRRSPKDREPLVILSRDNERISRPTKSQNIIQIISLVLCAHPRCRDGTSQREPWNRLPRDRAELWLHKYTYVYRGDDDSW